MNFARISLLFALGSITVLSFAQEGATQTSTRNDSLITKNTRKKIEQAATIGFTAGAATTLGIMYFDPTANALTKIGYCLSLASTTVGASILSLLYGRSLWKKAHKNNDGTKADTISVNNLPKCINKDLAGLAFTTPAAALSSYMLYSILTK